MRTLLRAIATKARDSVRSRSSSFDSQARSIRELVSAELRCRCESRILVGGIAEIAVRPSATCRCELDNFGHSRAIRAIAIRIGGRAASLEASVERCSVRDVAHRFIVSSSTRTYASLTVESVCF